MKKTLNEAGMQSELAGSAFFQVPSATESSASQSPVVSTLSAQPNEPGMEPPPSDSSTAGGTGVNTGGLPSVRPPVRRTITRGAFELYQDQIESLRLFSLDEKARGEKGSMSEMVREAIDAYLAKRHRTED